MIPRNPREARVNKIETLLDIYQIPIINLQDMGTARNPSKSVVKQVGTKLVDALSEKGLVLLVNHGIPSKKLHAAHRFFYDFCKLSDEDRRKYEHLGSTRGYVKPKDEKLLPPTNNKKELRHFFNICGDGGPLIVPDVPGFCAAMEELSQDFKQLTKMLLTALAVGMEQPPDFLLSKHSHLMAPGNKTSLQMQYCRSMPSREPDVTSSRGHSDYRTFTLITQDYDEGLEIQTPSGVRWFRVGHLPGAILLTAGEILDTWTDRQLPALHHRLAVPEHYSRERHFAAFLVQPDNNVEIQSLDVKIVKPVNVSEPHRRENNRITSLLKTLLLRLQRRV